MNSPQTGFTADLDAAKTVAVGAAKEARRRADYAAVEYRRAVANATIANENVYFVGAPEFRNTDGKEMCQKIMEATALAMARIDFDVGVIKPCLDWIANTQAAGGPQGSNNSDRSNLLGRLRDVARDCMAQVSSLSIAAALASDAAVAADARAAAFDTTKAGV